MKTLLIINGPNLNMLAKRQPEIYGYTALEDVEKSCTELCQDAGLAVQFFQSNHEGAIIDTIHAACETAAGIIINPGALSHTSVAILDALNIYEGPVFEVHISNIQKREIFRHHSYVSVRANGVIAGFGTQGYELAVLRLIRLLT